MGTILSRHISKMSALMRKEEEAETTHWYLACATEDGVLLGRCYTKDVRGGILALKKVAEGLLFSDVQELEKAAVWYQASMTGESELMLVSTNVAERVLAKKFTGVVGMLPVKAHKYVFLLIDSDIDPKDGPTFTIYWIHQYFE